MVTLTKKVQRVETELCFPGNMDASEIETIVDSLAPERILSLMESVEWPMTQTLTKPCSQRTRWHVESSHDDILKIACEVARREGWENVTWTKNFSALHLAAKLGDRESVRRLKEEISATPGLTVRDASGNLPVDYALALPEVDLELLELLDPSSKRLTSASRSVDSDLSRVRVWQNAVCAAYAKAQQTCGADLPRAAGIEVPDKAAENIAQLPFGGHEPHHRAHLPTLLSSKGLACDGRKGKPIDVPQGEKLD
jgi:hypothetical protein